MDKIRLYTRDTEKTVPMGPAAASRMTYMAGGALVNAIENLKKAMEECGAKTHEDLKKAGKPTIYEGKKVVEGPRELDPETGQGASFESDAVRLYRAAGDTAGVGRFPLRFDHPGDGDSPRLQRPFHRDGLSPAVARSRRLPRGHRLAPMVGRSRPPAWHCHRGDHVRGGGILDPSCLRFIL